MNHSTYSLCLPTICSIFCYKYRISHFDHWLLHSILSLFHWWLGWRTIRGLNVYSTRSKRLADCNMSPTCGRIDITKYKRTDDLLWEMSNSKSQLHELNVGLVKLSFTGTRRFIENVKSGQLRCWLKMRQTCKLRTLDPHFLSLQKVWDILVKNLKIQTN